MLPNTALDPKLIDTIIKKTLETINENKQEINEIASTTKKHCKDLEVEYYDVKINLESLKKDIISLQIGVDISKLELAQVSKYFNKYTQYQIKQVYEKADDLIVKLSLKEQQQDFLRDRREELERKIVEAYKALRRAEDTLLTINQTLQYLTGNLVDISEHLDDVAQKYQFGLKIIKAQEEERKRVAKEIFNGPINAMTKAVEISQLCYDKFDVDLEDAQKDVKYLKVIVRDSLKSLRQIIYNLRPMSLDDLGLIPTLQRYIDNFQEETNIDVLFKPSHLDYNIPPIICITIFRTVQESLINIKKHSKAKSARVILEFLFDKLNLLVADDGVGFDTTSFKAHTFDLSKYFGIFSMSERVELLKGTFEIMSTPNEGTKILITVPLISTLDDLNTN